jgi:hypothetical protein
MSTCNVCSGSEDARVWVPDDEDRTVDEPHPIDITRDTQVILKTTFNIYI